MTTHNFHDSLAASHSAEDLPFWEEAYKKAFPNMATMVNHRSDGDHQRNGIDRTIIMENSKVITIDEKVRFRNTKTGLVYEDIALEIWSDYDKRKPGWVCKPLMCDYIAYAIAPLGRCYLLPVLQLQEAYRRNQEKWTPPKYSLMRAFNNTGGRLWETHSIPVPVPELFQAVGACLRVEFLPCDKSLENLAREKQPTTEPFCY